MDASVRLLKRLHWLGHASFRLDGPPTIYFDPWRLEGVAPGADVVLVSHEHADHCSPDDVRRISGPGTVIVASPGAAGKLRGAVHMLRPGEQTAVGEAVIEAVPAYNVTRFRSPGVPFHPKKDKHTGFIVNVGGERIYFAADTDHIPEMADIRCDVALLPIGGTYTMDAEEAVRAAADIGAKVTVPMHCKAEDIERFRSLYAGELAVLKIE